jgi:hypothetical protein
MFGLVYVKGLVHPEIAKIISSTTGALAGAGSVLLHVQLL